MDGLQLQSSKSKLDLRSWEVVGTLGDWGTGGGGVDGMSLRSCTLSTGSWMGGSGGRSFGRSRPFTEVRLQQEIAIMHDSGPPKLKPALERELLGGKTCSGDTGSVLPLDQLTQPESSALATDLVTITYSSEFVIWVPFNSFLWSSWWAWHHCTSGVYVIRLYIYTSMGKARLASDNIFLFHQAIHKKTD